MSLNPFKPFASFLRPYRWALAAGLGFLLGEQLVAVSIPLVLERAINQARAGLEQAAPDLAFLPRYAALIVGLGLAQWGMAFGMRWHLAATSYRVERDIRQRYFAHLLTLPLGYFQQARTGDLMARATNDVEAVQRYLSHGFRMFLSALLGFGLSMTAMCLYDWELALFALLPMPVMVVILRLVGGKVRRRYRRVQEQFAAISTCLQESLAGMRVIKAFARSGGEIERFTRLNDEYVERNRRLIYLYSTFFPFTFLISGLSMVFILWLGGTRVVEGTLSLGAFVAFNAYLIRISRPMMFMGRIVDEYQRAMASMLRIESVLGEEPQADLYRDGGLAIRGEIEFRGASLRVRRPDRSARYRRPRSGGQHPGRRRPRRVGQEHPGPAHPQADPGRRGGGSHRRQAGRADADEGLPRRHRLRAAGHLPVLREHPRQHRPRLGPPGRGRTRRRGGAADRRPRDLSRRAGHRRRRARRHPFGGAEAAHRPGPFGGAETEDPHPRTTPWPTSTPAPKSGSSSACAASWPSAPPSSSPTASPRSWRPTASSSSTRGASSKRAPTANCSRAAASTPTCTAAST